MIRTEVRLTKEQAERLRKKAAIKGESIAKLIRDAVDHSLAVDEEDRARRWKRVLAAVGTARDREGATDVSRRHDHYLAEAYEDWR